MLSCQRAAARFRLSHLQVITLPRCVASHNKILVVPFSDGSGTMKVPLPPKPEGGEARPPTPPPEIPKGKKKRSKFGLLLKTTILGSVLVIGSAWLSEEFRKMLTDNVPYSQDMLDAVFVYLPDSPSVPAPILSGDKFKFALPKFDSKEEDAKLLPKLKMPVPEPPVTAQPGTSETAKSEPVKETQTKPAPEMTAAEKAERDKIEREANIKADNATLELMLADLTQLSETAVKAATEAQQTLVDAIKKHTKLIKSAMEDEGASKDDHWKAVAAAYDIRKMVSDEIEKVVLSAKENVEKLNQTIENGRNNANTKKNKELYAAKRKLDLLKKDMYNVQKEVNRAEAEGKSMAWYTDLILEGKSQLRKEVDSLLMTKSGKLTEEDWRLIYGHAHKRLEQLQKQFAEHLAFGEQKLNDALTDLAEKDEQKAKEKMEAERNKWTEEFEKEKQKWADRETDLLSQHARQMSAYTKRLNEEFEHELHLRLVEERQIFEGELAGWTARQRGIESALEARAENESTAKQAQELWLATVALNGAIMTGNENGKAWEEQLKPLEKEVDTLFFAAKNHPFVSLVLESIPEKALTRGVYTEENLKHRFQKVSNVAQKVALIGDTGGSLFKFMLSYFQSFFVFTTVYAKDESDKVEIADMDTFQLCTHAKYWLEKGNIEMALRFMNQLRGESRRVASDWIAEARLYLETRQAAHALMAFASSTGLGTLF